MSRVARGSVEGPRLAENIAGVDHTAEVFLVEMSFIARVGVDGAEGEARECRNSDTYVGRSIAKGCQDFMKCSVLPKRKNMGEFWEKKPMTVTMCRFGVHPLSGVCRH